VKTPKGAAAAVMAGVPYAYSKTARGQLLYDLAFTSLSPSYLARKHHLPVAKIRELRKIALKQLGMTARRPRKRKARK
jgi:hypothetical protein